MNEQPNKPSLSEISHLFLSSVRDRQTNGAPRPQRIPPGASAPKPAAAVAPVAPASTSDLPIELTPEEFAHVFADPQPAPATDKRHLPPVTAVLAAHVNGNPLDRTREYARHLVNLTGERIGLIELDAAEFHLISFDRTAGASEAAPTSDVLDMRQIADAIGELDCDVDRWLLVLPSPRTPEARSLLRAVGHWVLLSTCDHDGVVACYRTLKGLADLHRPKLSLAIAGARDEVEAGRVFHKLAGVSGEFLHWPLTPEPAVTQATSGVSEHVVMSCRAATARDKSQNGTTMPHWRVVSEFLAQDRAPAEPVGVAQAVPTATEVAVPRKDQHQVTVSPIEPPRGPTISVAGILPEKPESPMTQDAPDTDTVIDLPDADTSEASVLAAVLKHESGALVECPVRPPMCPQACLAVDRDRHIVLMAVARQGLADLRLIGQAYRWLIENRPLIAMALPQFAIDALRMPRLRLLVDHADVTADVLQPMLQIGNVTVQTYRKLRWGQKTGLLLEAA